jgi:regulator of cell morphogenesis and NO signaling
MMLTNTEFPGLSVADIAMQFPNSIAVLNKYHIDYCCGGNKPFELACKQAGISPSEVWSLIHNTATNGLLTFTAWSPSLLIDYIQELHHGYVRNNIPIIQNLLEKVCHAHGEEHPELIIIRKKFEMLADELMAHMMKEEEILFPAIKNSTHQQINLQLPISVMLDEHEAAGDLIKSIRTLSGDYQVPVDACPTYLITYKLLNEFDHDLMQHIHLENNILFKKVIGHES